MNGFDHTNKLKVMKFKEAMNDPESDNWKNEIKNEHKQILMNKVWEHLDQIVINGKKKSKILMNRIWEPLDEKDSLERAKVIKSTWACKKKSNSTYHGRLNARGFEQVAGKHFNPMSTAAPVMNDKTIRIVLILMLLVDWMARIYNVKGIVLKGKLASCIILLVKAVRDKKNMGHE